MRRSVRLKGIKVVRKPTGERYVYRRVKGALVPLPDLPENHPEFLEAYAAARLFEPKSKSSFAEGTIGKLIEEFRKSQSFNSRKESTRTVWNRRLENIRVKYGAGKVVDLRVEHIQKALKKLGPGAARSERTIWRALLEFAVEEEWRSDNPAMLIRNRRHTTTPHIAWTQDEIEEYRKFWPADSLQRQAMEVLYWTGARCSDAVNLGWQMVDEGILEFVQTKTGKPAFVPITVQVDDALLQDQVHFLQSIADNMVWILTARGQPRSVKGLSQFISKAASKAGLQGRTAHGLRKARATLLAQQGWTPHKIAAWTGHESLSEVEHYTRSVDKRKLVMRTEQDQNSGNSFEVVSINRQKT